MVLERSIAKESEPCSTVMEQSRIEETHATQEPAYQPKEVVLVRVGSGTTFLPTSQPKETLFKPNVSNWSWDWYVIVNKMKEKLTALFIGTLWVQICEMVTKMQWQKWKMQDRWAAYHRTQSRQNPKRLYGRVQKSWDQFDEYDSQELRCVRQTSEKKVHRWLRCKSNFLISEVPALWNLRTDLRRRLKDKSDAPAEMRGDLPRISVVSKKKKKLHSIRPPMSGVCRPHPENWRKESLWWIPEQVADGQQERPYLCRIGYCKSL